MLGIFITGPGGALLGLVLGVASRALPAGRRPAAFQATCIAWGGGILFFCLPGPEYKGEVIDAEVLTCEDAALRTDAAVAAWEKRVADAPWAKPPANWRDVDRLLAREPGSVATLAVLRASRIDEGRKPWNRGHLRAGRWRTESDTREFFAPGSSCDEWLSAGRALWYPISARSRTWPPDRVANFLDLQELAPVPASILALVDR